MPTPTSTDLAHPSDVMLQPLSDLERYAGWLARGFAPTRVRESVKALGATIAEDGDVFASVHELETDIGRLGSGEIPRLLRRALRSLRVALGPEAR